MTQIYISLCLSYLMGGRSHIVLITEEGTFEYQVSKKNDKGTPLWFVYCKTKEIDWGFMGTIFSDKRFVHSVKSVYDIDGIEGTWFNNVFKFSKNEEDIDGVALYRKGTTCSRCGRQLEDETSVQLGIGPVCRSREIWAI